MDQVISGEKQVKEFGGDHLRSHVLLLNGGVHRGRWSDKLIFSESNLV